MNKKDRSSVVVLAYMTLVHRQNRVRGHRTGLIFLELKDTSEENKKSQIARP